MHMHTLAKQCLEGLAELAWVMEQKDHTWCPHKTIRGQGRLIEEATQRLNFALDVLFMFPMRDPGARGRLSV